MKRIGGRLAGLAIAFGLASCQQPTGDHSDTTAITNRPQNRDKFIAIVKLENPALLTTARRDGGTVKVDEALKAAIVAEQQAFEEKLKALSSDVVVLHRYRMVLNALAVVAPKSLESELKALDGTSYVEAEQLFDRLDVQVSETEAGSDLARANSVAFIEGLRVHDELGVKGQEMTVGIIDTGIDYTHAMFGGSGTPEAFEGNDPNVVEEGSFPTAKVVGGIDLVGTEYNAASPEFGQHVPTPDSDPLDEGGHGTHVAGTVAGIGDGVKSYSGVAPEAKLHAIKVFGKDGSTGDATIIAALEYAADPNGDLDPSDQLDVVNLSLGSGYGTPHLLYTQAMANLVAGGTIAVASGGNSGHTSYIVGAPGTSDAAISVAASIDNMAHNWQFSASAFTLADGSEVLAKAVEATFTKPIADGDVRGKLVPIGLASQPLDPDTAAKLAGNVALIDRGAVTFCEKANHAVAAGAIAFVIANNVDGAPFRMGGDCSHDVPGIMVTKTIGDTLKESLAQGDVVITFKTDKVVEEPQLIDTLTDFSSRGPRSIDALIKPEVAAPGFNVISAKMGGGSETVQMSGTSMAAPHVAGLAALVKQARPDLTPAQLKSLIVNSTVSISDVEGKEYPVAMQGAGRVRAFAAATGKVTIEPATLSLGQVLVEKRKAIRDSLRLTNVSAEALTLTAEVSTDAGLVLKLPSTIELAVGEAKDIKLTAVLEPVFTEDAAVELDGFVNLKAGDTVVARIPVLAVARKAARIKAQELRVKATSPADAQGAAAALTIANAGETAGDALPFNLIARDERNASARANGNRHANCDLEASGFRIIEKEVEGEKLELLQIGVKLYNPVTTWHLCEVSVQIDGDGDGVADQELLGTIYQNYHDVGGADLFASVLTDASQMRQIRKDFETNWPNATKPDYSPAIQDVQEYGVYGHSTVAVVSADLKKLSRTRGGDLKVKIAVLGGTGSPEDDDFLAKHAAKWHTLNLGADAQGYVDLPEKITLAASETKTVELSAGTGRGKLLVLFPHNASNFSDVTRDDQSQLLNPKYGF